MAIDTRFIFNQIVHWVHTLPNTYLGSDYGADLRQYLHKPMSSFQADEIIKKMKQDIPILQTLPENAINILVTDVQDDTKEILIQVFDDVMVYSG